MKLSFWGGARMVTGANYLLDDGQTKILVDCGLHQGSRYCEEHNFEPFPYQPDSIAAVFVTHAHIDHIGRLPKLYADGFRGKIYSTPPTRDFAEALLIDSEKILNKEAAALGRPPLYDLLTIEQLMSLWEGVPYHQPIRQGGFEVEFYDAGHILGSSSVMVATNEGKKIVFSGDLGNSPAPLIRPTEPIKQADYLLLESTYGSRQHPEPERRKDLLENIVEETVKAGGTLMIPAFALERTQELLFELNELIENHRIPRVPIFLDSPLAIKLTAIYKKYSKNPMYFNEEAITLLRSGDAIFDFPGLTLTLTTEQSKEINQVSSPKIIIAGSGMSQGGRIIHHERRYLGDPQSTILFVGYQALGSLGRQILDGAKKVKILGEEVPVRCRVESISGYSAHADQLGLLAWLRPMRLSLQKVFLVQGEEEEMTALAQKIKDELALPTEMPKLGEAVDLA
jgi:metallo-beta-lactamase family protein